MKREVSPQVADIDVAALGRELTEMFTRSPADDLVKRLRESPFRGGGESRDEMMVRRQNERLQASDHIEALNAALDAATHALALPEVRALVLQLQNAVYRQAKDEWEASPLTIGDFADAPTVMRYLCERAVFDAALASIKGGA
jgi:hypothetical protein